MNKKGIVSDLVKPIVIRASENVFNHLLVNLVESPGHDDADPEAWDHEDNHSVADSDGREDCNANKPEPKEHIDLLIDDIESKNAKTIMNGHGSRRTVLVKSTLGHLMLIVNIPHQN